MSQKKLIGIAVVVIVIIIGGYVVWSKKMAPRTGGENSGLPVSQKNQNQNLNQVPTPAGGISANDSSFNGADDSEVSPDEKRSDEKADEAFRQQVIAYANQNVNKLAAPPANDKWDTPTFYFVGNSNVYVELYAIDTDLVGAKMLYKATKDGSGSIKLAEVARYKEGEEDWILSSGTDTYADYVMEEYDYNEDTRKWEKTDEFDESGSADSGADLGTGAPAGQIIP